MSALVVLVGHKHEHVLVPLASCGTKNQENQEMLVLSCFQIQEV